MILGAVLLVAQVGAHSVRTLLTTGDAQALHNIKPDDYGTAAQFTKALAKAPMLDVLRLLNKDKTLQIVEGLLQNADDLDYLQNLITSTGEQRV